MLSTLSCVFKFPLLKYHRISPSLFDSTGYHRRGRPPYFLAKTKDVRDAFRKARATTEGMLKALLYYCQQSVLSTTNAAILTSRNCYVDDLLDLHAWDAAGVPAALTGQLFLRATFNITPYNTAKSLRCFIY
jgi:hypothetical protein